MTANHWKSTWNMYYPNVDKEVKDWENEIKFILKRDPGNDVVASAIRNMRDDSDVNKFPRVGELINAIREVLYGHSDDDQRSSEQCDPCRSTGWLSVVKLDEGGYVTGACRCHQSVAVPCVCGSGQAVSRNSYNSEVDRQAFRRMAESAMSNLKESGGVCPLVCTCNDLPAKNTVAGFGRVSDGADKH